MTQRTRLLNRGRIRQQKPCGIIMKSPNVRSMTSCITAPPTFNFRQFLLHQKGSVPRVFGFGRPLVLVRYWPKFGENPKHGLFGGLGGTAFRDHFLLFGDFHSRREFQ